MTNLTQNQFDAIVTKLGGEENALRLLRNELVVHMKVPQFSKITTVSIGVVGGAEEARRLLSVAGGDITREADCLIGKMPFETSCSSLELYEVTAKELGLGRDATREDVYAKAKDFGFSLCPAEVVVPLWQHYLSFSRRSRRYDRYTIAMEPIQDTDGVAALLKMDSNSCIHPTTLYTSTKAYDSDRWVFVRK